MVESTDEKLMRLALCAARKGLGITSPNPAVGAVLASEGRILATGYHKKAGQPHAEIEALNALRDYRSAQGSTLYVTLEPCSTYGRTPPCTLAIRNAGISRVVVGSTDPNPKHQGKGFADLRRCGIEITTGVLEKQCTRLNAGFNKWITSGRPWVIAKVAQSLDGRLTRPVGEPSRLSNSHSIRMVHRLRSTVDAILVGAETVRKDDPELTVRYGPTDHQPFRVVVTKSGMLPVNARIFSGHQRTIIYDNRSWNDVLDDLGRRDVTRLLVEGGSQILGQLFDNRLIDEFWLFLAPRLVGGPVPTLGGSGIGKIAEAPQLVDIRYLRLKDDILIKGDLQWRKDQSRLSEQVDT